MGEQLADVGVDGCPAIEGGLQRLHVTVEVTVKEGHMKEGVGMEGLG